MTSVFECFGFNGDSMQTHDIGIWSGLGLTQRLTHVSLAHFWCLLWLAS